jgi:lipoprotein-anchoring transpeptidase ErfK/SrfK
MRKNFALLGATLVVCLATGPALASNGDIGEAFKRAAMALGKTTAIEAPLTTASIKSNVSANSVASRSLARKAKTTRKKAARRRVSERLVARINLSSQTMNVMVDGQLKHSWKISSGAKGYHTPTGSYKPYYMTSMHYSKKYNNAPMPHSVFFRGGYAVHATGAVRRLGNPASHGCVRLSPGNARKFFKLVQKYKKAGTAIKISGSTPASRSLKKRYVRKKIRTKRYDSWANIRGYGKTYVGYNARRRSASTVRRIRIGRSRVASNRRRTDSRIFSWQY